MSDVGALNSVPLFFAAGSSSNAALVTFGVYTLAVFVLAWLSHRVLTRRKFLSEYYLGSRSLGVLALTLSYGATSASAGSFVGFPAFVYAHGWIVALWIASYMLVPLCGMGLFGKRINQVARKAGAITLPDLLRGRFESRALALLATGAIVFMLSFYLIPQFKTASIIMGKLFADVPVYLSTKLWLAGVLKQIPLLAGVDAGYLLCLGLFAVLVVFYTTFGGFRAVVWTDVLQGFVMVFGVVFMLVAALSYVGGLSNATKELSQMTTPRLGAMVFEIDQAAPEDGYTVPADTWFTLPGEGGAKPRLFRTNFEAIIEPGKQHSNTVKVVEVTTPQEIEKITGGKSPFEQPKLPPGVSPRLVYTRVTFTVGSAAPADGVAIPADSWFEYWDAQDHKHLLGTKADAHISVGKSTSNQVEVSEVVDPDKRKKTVDALSGGKGEGRMLDEAVTVQPIRMRDYAAGAGQRGVYVSGPGPSATLNAGFLPFGMAISFFCFWSISGAGQPGNMVRLMAFDSSKTLKRSIAALTIYYGMIYFPLVVIFCCARLIVPALEQDPDRIMPELAFTLANAAHVPWLAGLLVAAPFAAAMSTVDSFMLMVSSSVVRDVYQRNINPHASQRTIKRLSYLCTLIVGLVVAIGAINPPKFLQILIVFTGGGIATTFLFPVGLGLYWRRFNTPGAIASMVGGFASYLSMYVAGVFVHGSPTSPVLLLDLHPLLWGFAGSLLLGIAFTYATKPPPQRLVRKFFYEG